MSAMDEQVKHLEAINPMISDEGWNGDTAHNIQCVLEFMADAIPAIISIGHCKETAHGANVILRTCAAALKACHE